jgi:hypothetical protein
MKRQPLGRGQHQGDTDYRDLVYNAKPVAIDVQNRRERRFNAIERKPPNIRRWRRLPPPTSGE